MRPAAAVDVPANFVVENAVTSGTFTVPTGIAFLPDGRYFVLEKRGRVYLVTNGVKAATPVINIESEVLDQHDRGLLGIAVDPNFNTNRLFYLLYTVDPNGSDTSIEAFGRLTRYKLAPNDQADLTTRTILIGDTWTNGVPIGSESHSIGSLRFGQDGSLLVSCGDGALFTGVDAGGQYPNLFTSGRTSTFEDIGAFRAQSLSSLAGKILRINPVDGSGYPSNPFWDGNALSKRSRIWCYGLRNPFRFNIRPNSGSSDPAVGDPGSLYIGDVGWETWEEADVTSTGGKNFGWPCYEGRHSNTQYQSANPAHNGCGSIGTSDNPVSPTLPPMDWHHSDPALGTPGGFAGNCSIGGVFYVSTLYPSTYQGRYFYADYGQNWIRTATFSSSDGFQSTSGFAANADGPVDFATNPITGDVFYVAILANEVRRIRYTAAAGNGAPVAMASANPTSGTTPLTVQFSSSGSFDPDGDPITYAWNFGDGQGDTALNPSHVYTTGGLYDAILTLNDNKGGVGRDTVTIAVAGAGSFPTTPVLDNFNRANGAIGSSWSGTTAGLTITSNQLAQTSGYASPVWNPTTFGNNQEAYVTIAAITNGSTEHDLMLKIQGLSWDTGHIEVRYDADPKTVTVSTYAPGQGWVTRGGPYVANLVAGDRLGARAYPNGMVEVYRNATLIGTANVSGWAFYANGGRIGMTIANATASRFDNFGGGNAVLNSNTPPDVTIQSPADGSFYALGVPVTLVGTATDAQDASANLSYRWELDLHHNNHIHPLSQVFTTATATFYGENHDDGTGVYYLCRFIATDTGGLSDTTSINLYPDIDLNPGPIQIAPGTLTDATPFNVTFALRNLGSLPAPISRWNIRIDGTVAAFGDTVVPLRDSVMITRNMAPLSGGSHVIRAVADTLGQWRETNETNNASTRSVTVADGQPPNFVTGPTATPGATTATIAWSTNEPASGAVRYGTSPSLGDSATVGLATSQSRTITGLTRGTAYSYQVAATDASGNTRLSSLLGFTTLANQPPVASATGSPNAGAPPLTVQFSSAGSGDPDGDAITTSWNFGDGSANSTAANPSHLYAAAGNYTAVLTVTDAFNATATASVPISVGAVFPTTAVLDNFNRANGSIGTVWVGQAVNMSINNNRLVQTANGSTTMWMNIAPFAADQEAYIKLMALTPSSPEHDVLLKVQGAFVPTPHIEVRYDITYQRVYVSTWSSTGGWITHASVAQTFAVGDMLGARAYANGSVEVYRNATKILTTSVTSWPFYNLGGRVGMGCENATSSAFDDFGGGSYVTGPDVTPPVFTTGPTVTPALNSAQVNWTTNESSVGHVRYGLTASLGDSVATPQGTTHAATIPNLTRGTTYNYRVAATDPSGNTALTTTTTFATLANRAPVAAASGSPTSGTAPLTVQFSSAGSSDPDGDAITTTWNFGDGSANSTAANPSHLYAAGNWTATLTVADAYGGSAQKTVGVSAGATDTTPPQFVTGPTVTPSVTTATVQWTTNESTYGSIAYGTTPSLGTTTTTPLGTSHSKTLTPLLRNTLYYYQVTATDPSTNATSTSVLSFTTQPNRPPVAAASGSPVSGVAPLAVTFSSSGSSDPDGDALGYSWTFGDGKTSTAASPSNTYASPGNYTAQLTVSDGFGGTASATVPISVTTGTFPATAVLDNFNRADGPVGGSWFDFTTSGLAISGQQLAPTGGGDASPIFNGGVYGANQEAFVTFKTISGTAEEHDVLLKVQGELWWDGHIEVRYDGTLRKLLVSTYAPSQGWRGYGSPISVTLANGDVIGARAFSNGTLEVYRNGTRIGSFSLTAWPFYAQGGRIGMTISSGTLARFDDFGGGTLPGGINPGFTAPTPSMALADRMSAAAAISNPFPNPVSAAMQFTVTLPKPQTVDWEILDMTGRIVSHQHADLAAGTSPLGWKRDPRLAPGVYAIRVRAPGLELSRRFVLLR